MVHISALHVLRSTVEQPDPEPKEIEWLQIEKPERILTVEDNEVSSVRTRSRTAPKDVLSLSHTWSSHYRERQNTFRVVFSNAVLSYLENK